MINDDLEALKPRIKSWKLAQDTALRKALEKFTDGMVKNMEEQEKTIKEVYHECSRAKIRVENINNEISYLKNFKFIEHKIKEDDEPISSHKPIYKQKTKEERQNEMIGNIKQAVGKCFDMVEENFKKIEIKASDFEDDLGDLDTSYIPDPVFEPLNPYLRRPLPHLIASENWYESLSAGLDATLEMQTVQKPSQEEEIVIGLPHHVTPRQKVPQPTQAATSSSSAYVRQEERMSTTSFASLRQDEHLSITPSIPSRESSPWLDTEPSYDQVPQAIKNPQPTPVLPQGHQKQLFEELFKKTRQVPPAAGSTSSSNSPKSQRSMVQDTISDGVPSLPKDADRASLTSRTSQFSRQSLQRESPITAPKSSIFDGSSTEEEDDLFAKVAKKMQKAPPKVPTPVKSIPESVIAQKPIPKPRSDESKAVVQEVRDVLATRARTQEVVDGNVTWVEKHEAKPNVVEPIQNTHKTYQEPVKSIKQKDAQASPARQEVKAEPQTAPVATSKPSTQATSVPATTPTATTSTMGLFQSKKKSIFDDSDSDDGLFGSSRSSQKSSKSIKSSTSASKVAPKKATITAAIAKQESKVNKEIKQETAQAPLAVPEKAKVTPRPTSTVASLKKKSLFDSDSSEDELFKPGPLSKSSSASSHKASTSISVAKIPPSAVKTSSISREDPKVDKIEPITDPKEVIRNAEPAKSEQDQAWPEEEKQRIEGRISPSQRPASVAVASTSELEPITNGLSENEPKKPTPRISNNEESGPSSVKNRIAQIGMKIPMGPPGARRPMSMVGEIRSESSGDEKAAEKSGSETEPGPKLSSLVKSRPKGPTRRAPTTHRNTLAQVSESASGSTGESDTTLSPTTVASGQTLRLSESETSTQVPKKSPGATAPAAQAAPEATLPPRPPSIADNAAKLAQEALEKRKISPRASTGSVSSEDGDKSKTPVGQASPKVQMSPKASPKASPTLIRASATVISVNKSIEVSKTADGPKKKSLFESSSSDEDVFRSGSKTATSTAPKVAPPSNSNNIKEPHKPATTKSVTKKSLFDDSDSDDIFKKK